MMYAIVKIINGNYFIHAEGFTDQSSAKASFHSLCQSLWNAPDVYTACVTIIDENFDIVYGNNMTKYQEFIYHEAPQPEPEPEPTPEPTEG